MKHALNFFSASEQVPFALQKKIITIQDALSAVHGARHTISVFVLMRSLTVSTILWLNLLRNNNYEIGMSEITRYRCQPSQITGGAVDHIYYRLVTGYVVYTIYAMTMLTWKPVTSYLLN